MFLKQGLVVSMLIGEYRNSSVQIENKLKRA